MELEEESFWWPRLAAAFKRFNAEAVGPVSVGSQLLAHAEGHGFSVVVCKRTASQTFLLFVANLLFSQICPRNGFCMYPHLDNEPKYM